MSRIQVLGNPENERVTSFQAALGRLGLPDAEVLPWEDFLRHRRSPAPGTLLRIESPGENAAVEQLLLERGEDEPDERFAAPRLLAKDYVEDRGRILAPRQHHLGLRAARRDFPEDGARAMNGPADIATMGDKPSCHELLVRRGIPRPPVLGYPRSFEELRPLMARHPRVFVKLANGSSASGVVAYQTDGGRHLAITSVEREEDRLYNSQRLRRYEDVREIAALFDLLCREGVMVEAWIPKPTLNGRSLDLRVVVIGGRARHVVVRTSPSPITNLHLGRENRRGDPAAVRARLGERRWADALGTCERALDAFRESLYAGVDLLLSADGRREYIGEVNAFGDLLRRTLCDGRDPYEWELLAALEGAARD